ncbi:hypothetical protein AMS68_002269 [Peltaster fructicola]|uniref:Uncharacterized protein n=1 Tax=Peltaster fructicola TaxID=286661 RepID=A0A6H0XPR1_9PEZI|nr:hypothetical protein AMS68_002269 [Peltaster fructicola]
MSPQLDNSGHGKLQVPGFGDVPLVFTLPYQDRFSHGIEEWCQLPGVTLREFAMTGAMNWVTDQDDWSRGVYDEIRVAAWKADVMREFPLISERAWNWCVSELQDKAKFFLEKSFVEVLDAGSLVYKSDVLLPEAFADRMAAALKPLQAVRAPGHDLVDPCVCPLIYGTTEVLTEGGRTTIDNLYPAGHPLSTAPLQPDSKTAQDLYEAHLQEFGMEDIEQLRNTALKADEPGLFFWSSRYQSLPCDISFLPDGVSIQSYVNNLHPSFKDVYSCLEAMIAASINPWNYCLIRGGQDWVNDEDPGSPDSCINSWVQTQRGRKPLRIVTFGVQWADGLPSWAIAFDESIKQELQDYQNNTGSAAHVQIYQPLLLAASRKAYADAVLQLHPIPQPTQKTLEQARAYLGQSSLSMQAVDMFQLEQKAMADRRWLHPEPGTAISYRDWRDGCGIDKAIVEMDDRTQKLGDAPLPAGPTHSPYEVRLQEQFRAQGVQVIIKIGSIDLVAGQVEYQEQWHLEGHLNEHVVASSLYVYEACNVTGSVSFRQETPMDGALYRDDSRRAPPWVRERSSHGTDSFRSTKGNDMHGICEVFDLPELAMDPYYAPEYLPLYETGQVKLRKGRLVAFPNVIESRMVVDLIDNTLPGQLRYVAVSLVDPHYRICSTAIVPPQQQHWKPGPEAPTAEQLSTVNDGMKEHWREMLKEIQWLNMARYCRMETLGWADYI